MTTQTEALKLALEALKECRRDHRLKYEHLAYDKTITAIKEALAQPEQEHVAWNEPTPDFHITELSRNTILHHNQIWGRQDFSKRKQADCVVPVWFTAPPQRTWVGLTDEEHMILYTKADSGLHDWAMAIEAKLKEKNT